MLAAILMCLAVSGFAQVADGDYYLYNAEAKQFLSRGEDWGTRACVDKYGVPFTWNSTEGSLKFLDNSLCLFETNGTFYTDNNSTGFSFEEATDGYYLKSTASGSYITLQEGTKLGLLKILMPTADQAAATVWQLKSKAERDAIVATYANENYEHVIAASGISATADNFLAVLASYTPVDVTSSIGTAKFNGSVGDWTYTAGRNSNGGALAYGANYCEQWQYTGCHTQTITGLPEGIYKVTVNGFERAGGYVKCNTLAESGYEIVTASLMANDEQVALKSWYSSKTETNDPNNTTQAVAKFEAGNYLNEVYVYVDAKGELKINLAKNSHVGDNWVCFNNFTLTRYDAPTVLSPTEENALELGKSYILGVTGQHTVTYTAAADGYLTITCSKTTSLTSAKYNGTSTSDYEKLGGGSIKVAMAKDAVFSVKYYTYSDIEATGPYGIMATFEECVPYTTLTLDTANPADGGEYSAAAIYYTTYSTYKGQPYYKFSTKLNTTKPQAMVQVGEKVYGPMKLTVSGDYILIKNLGDTLAVAKEEGLISAGGQFTVTLSGLEDVKFAVNTLADQTFTYTLASTACTGVTPAASTSRTVLPEEVVFSFDGEVLTDNAEFYFVNKNTNEQTALTGTVDGNSVKIAIPAIDGILPKLYDIVAKGVTDANGKVITYGETAGQLTASYGTANGYFKATTEPANYAEVSSLKTYTVTLPGAVVYDDSKATSKNIVINKLSETTGWTEMENITISYAISEETPNVITFTLSEEITTPGDYMLQVPGKLFWSKDFYDAENLSDQTCYYVTSQNISCTILPYGPATVTPADGATLNELKQIVLAFNEDIEVDDEAEVAVLKLTNTEDEYGWPIVSTDTIATAFLALNFDGKSATVDLGNIDSVGTYSVVIPEGAIWAFDDESRKIGEWTYTYDVDPDYWDPEWVVEVSGTSKESPVELVAGRKYSFSDMYAYMTYTATEDGRLYLQVLDDRSYPDLWLTDDTWYNLGDLAKNEEGLYWVGVGAGQSVYMNDYGFGSRLYQVSFEAGSPYDALEYTGSFPVDGGLYSKSTEAPESWENGAVEFYFNTKINIDEVKVSIVLPSKNNKKIDVTEDVSLLQGNIDYGKQPAYLGIVLANIIDDIKTENGLKAGDAMQVVVENVQDLNFASNALAEPLTLNLTLAATVCTSINPNPSYGVDGVPTELSLRFDGAVSCANGKGWIIDVNSGNKQEFAIENFATEEVETWSGIVHDGTLTLPEATIELTSKKFAIQLEGLVDEAGNVLSYGDEVGKFTIDYAIRDDNFKYVSIDPENESNVASMKSIKLTFGEKVYLAPDAEAPYFWTDDAEITGTMEIDPTDENSVIITWSEEVTAAGAYYPTIPSGAIYNSKFDASKEDYGLADGAGYNPYISLEYYITADVSATTVASITPASYGETWEPVNSLPAEVVIEFEGNVKEVVNAYGERAMWSTRSTEVPEDAIQFETKLVDNKVIVTIPAEVISEITFGEFNITVNAIGEDGKPIGSIDDPYAENITFAYYVYKTLQLVESVPADGATVSELSTIKLTFDNTIAEIDAMYEFPCIFDGNWDKVADLAYSFEGNEVTLTLTEPVTTKGEYIVYVPAEIICDESWTSNNEINLYVTVGDEAPAELAIVSATPENGATVETLTKVEFKLNKEVGYLDKTMLIGDNGEDAHGATLTQSADDPTVYTLDFTYDGLYENIELKKGVTYTMTLTSWASEEACNYGQGKSETVTLTYVGASEGFQYSAITLESITPAEDFIISDKSQNKFVVKFSGPVELVESLTYINMGQGATQAFESVVANDGKTEYTLTIAESVLAAIRGTVNIVFAANDLDGLRLQGNNGEGEYSTFAYYYTTTIGVPDLTVTSGDVEELSVISIKCESGIIPSYTAGNITLTDANGNAIALNEPEAVETADAYATPTEWTVSLQEELTTVGTYTLTIPAGYFNIGSAQGQIQNSKETVVTINVTGNVTAIRGIRIDADAEVTVYDVTGVMVGNGKASEVLKTLTKGLYIVNGKKLVIK